jgi:CubicO group peptidase (beta-lactamase class C family)
MDRRTLVALVAVVHLVVPARSQQREPAPIIARIEAAQSPNRGGYDARAVHELMDRLRVPGVSVAVVKDFAIHWAKAYGVADVETGLPHSAQPWRRIACG